MTAPLLDSGYAGQLPDGRYARQLPDADAGLTGEWLESLDDLVDAHGPAAARVMLTPPPRPGRRA